MSLFLQIFSRLAEIKGMAVQSFDFQGMPPFLSLRYAWEMHKVILISKQLIKFLLTKLDGLTASRNSQVIHHGDLNVIDTNIPLLFYIHYSKDDLLSQHEIETLSNVRKIGIQVCLVINSNNPQMILTSPKREIQQNYFDVKIVRKNKGYDLAAYRDAFYLIKSNSKEIEKPVFFMNNSLFWIPEMIGTYFKSLLTGDQDIVASSISNQYRRHIQTFLFGALTIEGMNQIDSWFKLIKNWRLKRTIVALGEIKTHYILRSNLKVIDVPSLSEVQELSLKKIHNSFELPDTKRKKFTIDRLIGNRNLLFDGIPTNPSHAYWLERVELGFPGIKIDLIRNNPAHLPDYEAAIDCLLKFGYTYREINEVINSNPVRSLKVKIRSRINW